MSERCAGCGQPVYRVVSPSGEEKLATFDELLRAMWEANAALRALHARWAARAQGDDAICEGFRQCAEDLRGFLEEAP